ncbi:MAG: O-antigen ligase family protein [Bacteroidota bacterium]
MKEWIHETILTPRFEKILTVLLLSLLSLFFAYFTSANELKDALLIGSLCLLPVGVYVVTNLKFGFYTTLILSFFMAFINRLLGVGVPFGVLIDLILCALCFLLLINLIRKRDDSFSDFGNPTTYLLLIFVLYYFMQVANPEGTLYGWFYGIRSVVRMLMIYLIFWKLFDNYQDFKQFVGLYLTLAAFAALYGLYQEFFGLPSYDLRWATSDEKLMHLLFQAGKWRKFSILPDSSSFGLFMTLIVIISALFAIPKTRFRYVYIFLSIISLIGVFAAAIRTAYVILPIGSVFYIILNITDVRKITIAVFSILFLVALYFSPIHNPTLDRFRSAFNPTEDSSMQLRDVNRELIRPYIHSHPFGGGLSTTGANGYKYAPHHELAGFPPDSGFMESILETGWVGFFIELLLYIVVIVTGIIHLFQAKSPEIRSYYLAFIVGFFSLTIAYYSKKGVDQFPINYFLYGTFVVVNKLKKHDQLLFQKPVIPS